MQTDRIEKNNIKDQFDKLPKRSLSYNDIKKKRLIRSEKSKNKLKPELHDNLISQTQKKKPTSNQFSIGTSTQPKQQQQQSTRLQKSFLELKQSSDGIKRLSKSNKYIISKPFYTQRMMNDNKKKSIFQISNIKNDISIHKNDKKNSFFQNMDMAGNQKQLIKQIISKKKSQRMLLKFDQIRAQIKKSKSKSKLNSLQQQTEPHSNIAVSKTVAVLQPNKSIKNIRINKFETVKQRSIEVFNPSSKTENVSNNPTNQILNRDSRNIKSQYQSRRRLKIQDFKTQRTYQAQKQLKIVRKMPNLIDNQSSSTSKLKFHRKLRKSHSQIVIKLRNKQKSVSTIEPQASTQKKQILSKSNLSKENRRQKSISVSPTLPIQSVHNNKQKLKNHHKQFFSLNKFTQSDRYFDHQINLSKDLQMSVINISQIQIKKQTFCLDVSNQIDLVQALEDQQIGIKVSNQPHPINKSNSYQKEALSMKKKKTTSDKPKKQTKQQQSYIQNAQNMQNLSNILDFLALPTKQLKIKINRCNKLSKKKNQLQKFKKIFPINFFNN